MKVFWLNKKNNEKLIVFFNGWANDENHLKRFDCGDFDVVLLYDYEDLEFDFSEINSYEKQYVIAWSMGVWVFSRVQNEFENLEFKVAVNGTLKPIDEKCGIPIGIFEATLKNYKEETREKFYKRMFASKADFKRFLEIKPKRSADNQKQELISLQQQILSSDVSQVEFDKVIISKKDLIVPTKNQQNFYSNLDGVELIEGGHYPFLNWNSFNEIINE